MSQAGIYNTGGVVPPGTAVVTITGNTGGAIPPDGAGNINLVNVNTTVDIQGNLGLNTLSQQFGISNLVLGDDLSFLTTGLRNVGLGLSALNQVTSGNDNTAIGFGAGTSMAGASNANTAVGSLALDALTLGSSNAAFGSDALSGLTSGQQNTAIGTNALSVLTIGSFNTILGYDTGSAYNAAQSSNILIANTGDVADNNTIRIGNQGNGAGQQNRNFQAGIYGVTPAIASPLPVVIDSDGQLGTDAGGGIVLTLTGNTGGPIAPVAGNINILNANTTVDIAGTAGTLTQDFGISNLILGSNAASITSASENVGLGLNAFSFLTSGSSNVAIGFGAGQGITDGSRNICIGRSATAALPGSGTDGVAIGYNAQSGVFNTNTFNIAIGTNAGSVNLAAASNSNILLNALNANNASNQLIIGRGTGTGTQQLSSAKICGIDGVNVGSVAKVVTMASDQLGTATITAGSGITVTPGANTITISSTGADVLAYTNVNATPYVVLTTDEYLSVDTSALSITVQLPNAATLGRVFIIKDRTGAAATRNITVTTVGGAVNIDGATTFVMNTNFQSIQVIGNGSTYEIF